jgi:uncharacterized protein
VVLVARRAAKLAELADELGDAASVVPADLSRREDRAALPDRVAAVGRHVDILVNNAGLTTVGPVAAAHPAAELNATEDAEAALPKALWVAAADVARAGVALVAASKAVVVPGRLNRVSSAAHHLVPRGVLLPLLARGHPGLKKK